MADSDEVSVALTKSAELALDEYLAELRRELILQAAARAGAYNADDVVGVRDVMIAASDLGLGEKISGPRRTNRIPKLLRIYVGMGAIIAFLGLIWAAAPWLKSLDSQTSLGLVFSLSGTLIGVVAAIASLWLARRSDLPISQPAGAAPLYIEGEFLRTYANLELAFRAAVATRGGESTSRTPLRQLFDTARNLRLITDGEFNELQELTRARNTVAHGKPVEPASLSALNRRAAEISRSISRTATAE